MKPSSINFFTFVLFSTLEFKYIATAQREDGDLNGLVDHLLNSSVYNNLVRPNNHGSPVEVNISLDLYAISNVDEIKMEMIYTIEFIQQWIDPRLSFEPVNNNTEIWLTPALWPKIWKPEVIISGLTELKQITDFNTGGTEGTLRISSSGSVEFTVSMTLTAPCAMQFQNFPADQQRCNIDIMTLVYDDRNLRLKWNNDSGFTTSGSYSNMPNNRITYRYAGNYTVIKHGGHNATNLYAQIVMERSIGYYVNQVYVPAFLVVLISWIPFWLQRDHHARVGLGVTTVLTITTLITNTESNLPKVSYITLLDIYLFTSFLMVFLSLVEYAIVGYFECDMEASSTGVEDLESKPQPQGHVVKKRTARIDFWARAGFPAVFLAFNFYYIVYIYTIFRQNEHNIPEDYTRIAY